VLRNRLIVFAVALTVLSLLISGVGAAAHAQSSQPSVVDDPGAMADQELLAALETAGMLDEWFEATNRSPATAMLRVDSESYSTLRREVIKQAMTLAEASKIPNRLEELRAQQQLLHAEQVRLITQSILDGQALAENAAAVKTVDEALIKLLFEQATADADPDAARAQLLGSIGTLHSLRASAISEIDELPLAVIDSYVAAAASAPADCRVDWTLLAGIGRIESLHGTLDGSSVSSDGGTWPHIFGPLLDGGATERELAEAEEAALAAEQAEDEEVDPTTLSAVERYPELYGPLLGTDNEDEATEATDNEDEATDATTEGDGVADLQDSGDATSEEDGGGGGGEADDTEEDEEEGNGFAVIEDTDGGSLDGNDRWDRAVGPMQFIPGTWALFDTDGNGDGWADPHNFYDAAASAATYLCHLETRNGADPWVFVRGYNNSSAYVADVMETSARIAASYPLPTITLTSPDEATD